MSSATAAHLVSAVSAGPTDHKPILAARFKTKMCRNHVVHGFCPYEQRCMFAHGEEDMRTKEMNLADHLTTEEAIKAFQRAKFAAKARAAMLAVAEDSESAVLPALPEVEEELVSWKDVVKQRADGSYRYSPYSRWAPFFVEAELVESSAPLAPFAADPIEAPIVPRWTAYSCTCPACQCGAPVAQAPSAAPPKYVAEMAPRHKVLVP